MATCQVQLREIIDAGNISLIPVLNPDTDESISIGFDTNALFQINTISFNTSLFTINLVPSGIPPNNIRSSSNVLSI